jgi:hypothetical protein
MIQTQTRCFDQAGRTLPGFSAVVVTNVGYRRRTSKGRLAERHRQALNQLRRVGRASVIKDSMRVKRVRVCIWHSRDLQRANLVGRSTAALQTLRPGARTSGSVYDRHERPLAVVRDLRLRRSAAS